jgi:mono/diheme cytochrome c family protein
VRFDGKHWLSSSVVGAVGILMVVGCRPSLGPSKEQTGAPLSKQEMVGLGIYQQNCASCHYATHTGDLHGPSLFGLYRKPYMQSGAPANDDRVTAVTLHGHGMMPGFEGQLNAEQLQALLAYLHTL